MNWIDEITLVTTKDIINDNGFPDTVDVNEFTVFANKKSVGAKEFYMASSEGYSLELKFDIYDKEYSNQKVAIYNGVRYRILRTYVNPKNPDILELTLSDLKEKGNLNG